MVIDQMFKQDPHGKPALLCQTAIEGAGDFAALDEAEDLRIFLITIRLQHFHCLAVGILGSFQDVADIADAAVGVLLFDTVDEGTFTLLVREHVVTGDNSYVCGFLHKQIQHTGGNTAGSDRHSRGCHPEKVPN